MLKKLFKKESEPKRLAPPNIKPLRRKLIFYALAEGASVYEVSQIFNLKSKAVKRIIK